MWEYKVESIRWDGPDTESSFAGRLNIWGQDRWELVEVFTHPIDHPAYILVFKRPKQQTRPMSKGGNIDFEVKG